MVTPITDDEAAARILTWVNEHHGGDFRLAGKLPGGRQGGAYRAWSAAEGPVVFKWTDKPGLARRRSQAQDAVSALRSRNYPTPAWLASGVTDDGVAYVIQEFATGVPGVWSTVPLNELCAAVELQAGLGRPGGAESWSTYVEGIARDDSGPRAELQATAAGRALVQHFDLVLAEYGACAMPENDLVHGDVNTSNVLVADGHVAALVDIEAIGSGTRAIDYGWLLREAFTVGAPISDMDLIRASGVRVAGPAVFATCVAATAFDITAFERRTSSGGSDHSRPPEGLHALAEFVRLPDRPGSDLGQEARSQMPPAAPTF